MMGTMSEHATLYQYALVDAKNHYIDLIKTKMISSSLQMHRLHGLILCLQPYYQPLPVAPDPLSVNAATQHSKTQPWHRAPLLGSLD
jgi:hypothetical protein